VEAEPSLQGVVWPQVAAIDGEALKSVIVQMEKTQYLPPEELFQQQRRQLATMCLHAKQSSPFYAERFADAGFDPRAEITPDIFRRLPILTRSDYQNAALETMPLNIPADHGENGEIRSSGTTGRAITVIKTELCNLMMFATEIRGHLWHKRDVKKKLAMIRYMDKTKAMAPSGLEYENWGPATGMLFSETGACVFLNIANNLKDQADWLIRHNPEYILSYPSNLLALGKYFERNGLSLPGLRQVCTVSELVSAQLRETIWRVWNVPVKDLYACEETGYLAHQCPDHEHYHVQSESAYLEIVDENGAPCPVGETGRVLVTTLHNFATPLIRYEVGDYATWGQACPCGRGLPVLTSIQGRARNRLALPDGQSEFAYLADYHDDPAIQQFQCIQRSLTEIELKLVVSEPLTHEQQENIKELLIRSLGRPLNVRLSFHDEIPRNAGGKFEEFICDVRP
jgi:phenylacetate-CoA ligase